MVVTCSSGEHDACASPIAATALAAPGPEVVTQTPGRPVRRPWTSAAYAAVASWRTTMVRRPAVSSAANSARLWTPGIPNTVSTPRSARAATIASATVIASCPG